MSRASAVLIAAGAALLLVVIAAVILLQLGRDDVARELGGSPSATATPVRSPSASPTPTDEPTPEPTEEPTPEPSAGLESRLAAIEEQVLALRGLPRPDIPPAEFLTRDELQDELVEIFGEDYPEEEQFADNVTLYAMGLLSEDQDIWEIELQLLATGVLGFYDDQDKSISVVSNAGLDAEAQLTYAHEYTHALQDATFEIASLELDAVGDDDAATARLSLLEGDAELTALLWAADHLDADDGFGGGEPPPDLTGIPGWLIQSIIFPYTVGTDFVATLWQDGGFQAVDAAYDHPPRSTEQVIHPELYFADEPPVAVELLNLGAELGVGWQQVESTPIGEAMIDMTLQHLGVAPSDARDAAAGWGGDRLSVAAGQDGDFALAWRLVWDTPADADQFAATYQQALPALAFPGAVLQIDQNTVVIGHASDDAVLRAVMDAASR